MSDWKKELADAFRKACDEVDVKHIFLFLADSLDPPELHPPEPEPEKPKFEPGELVMFENTYLRAMGADGVHYLDGGLFTTDMEHIRKATGPDIHKYVVAYPAGIENALRYMVRALYKEQP